jgi:hypothetical protein
MLQNTVVAVNVSTSSSNSTSSSSSSFKLKYKYRFIQRKCFYMEKKQFNKTKFTCVVNMYNYCHTQFQVPLLSGSSVIKTAEV